MTRKHPWYNWKRTPFLENKHILTLIATIAFSLKKQPFLHILLVAHVYNTSIQVLPGTREKRLLPYLFTITLSFDKLNLVVLAMTFMCFVCIYMTTEAKFNLLMYLAQIGLQNETKWTV